MDGTTIICSSFPEHGHCGQAHGLSALQMFDFRWGGWFAVHDLVVCIIHAWPHGHGDTTWHIIHNEGEQHVSQASILESSSWLGLAGTDALARDSVRP